MAMYLHSEMFQSTLYVRCLQHQDLTIIIEIIVQ